MIGVKVRGAGWRLWCAGSTKSNFTRDEKVEVPMGNLKSREMLTSIDKKNKHYDINCTLKNLFEAKTHPHTFDSDVDVGLEERLGLQKQVCISQQDAWFLSFAQARTMQPAVTAVSTH